MGAVRGAIDEPITDDGSNVAPICPEDPIALNAANYLAGAAMDLVARHLKSSPVLGVEIHTF